MMILANKTYTADEILETALKFLRIGPGSLAVYKENKNTFFGDLMSYSKDDCEMVRDMLLQGYEAVKRLKELEGEKSSV